MSLDLSCSRCWHPIDEPGALLFGPPNDEGSCVKRHLCRECYRVVLHLIRPDR